MSMNNEKTPHTTDPAAPVAEYERPRVTDLGSLAELTLSSTSGVQSDGLNGAPGTGGS